ncbi:MAG: SAM-dependent methyltransferase, partial [Gammaproteobacteria bacterium]|nr:SAM-dependent methyltransferase [Gammaproteobacteria bacterium]
MQSNQPLQDWFSTTTGRLLLQQERAWNSEALKQVYGMHLMQLGLAKENFAKQAVEIYHAFVMDIGSHEEQSWAVLEGQDVALPIATESLSAVILPHVLEFSSDPHQVLREVT